MEKNVYVSMAFVCAITLITATFAVTGVFMSEDEDINIVMVDFTDARDISYLHYSGATILETYPNRVLVEVTEDGLNNIRSAGMYVNTLPARTRVSVKSHTFDIRDGMPEFCEELTIDGYEPGTEGLYILHTIGPIHPRWVTMLEQAGVELINYVPNYAYEVRMTPDTAERVEEFDFVDFIGIYQPGFKLADDLEPGIIRIRLLPGVSIESLDSNVNILSVHEISDLGTFVTALVEDESTIHSIARMPEVYRISLPITEERPLDEMQTQTIGGGLWYWDPDNDPTTAFRLADGGEPPYAGNAGAYVNQLGYTGEGVTITIADSGIYPDHPDFQDRVIGGYSFVEGESWIDLGTWGHGTHCAGSAAADTFHGTGQTVYNNYYSGQGMAPRAELFSVRVFNQDGANHFPEDRYEVLEAAAQNSDTYVHSNSYGAAGNSVYDLRASRFDKAVRDANRDTGFNQPLVVTVSAGNSGPDLNSISSPATAKNVIAVGASQHYSPNTRGGSDDPGRVSLLSSRGWTNDNRIKPDLMAPGCEHVTSTMPGGGYDTKFGTSMSNPAVAGAAAVTVEWYEKHYGYRPSPAMVKALLINTAVDLDRSDNYPNQHVGWGMVNLVNLIDSNAPFMLSDQTTLLTTGQINEYSIDVDSTFEPLKLTLVWTDQEASEDDALTLKNDLNLEVVSPSGDVYRGNAFNSVGGEEGSDTGFTFPNVDTMAPFDTTGDGWDNVNNVQCIYIHPDDLEDGVYTVRVIGENIPEDANNDGSPNQDYALVVYNAMDELPGDPPEVTLTRPQGGESFTAGEAEDILWTASAGDDPVDHVSLFYSPDGGTVWNTIETGIGDTGSYTWMVPNEHSSVCLLRVQVRDTSGRTAEDVSGAFSIEGIPPAPPSGLNVQLYGTAQAISNSMFEDDHEPWELTRVVDEGEARWDPENHIDGGSIYVSVEAEGENVRLTEDSYWEQSISPTSEEIIISSAFRKNILYDDGMGWETQVHSALVELMVHDTDVGWYTVLMDDETTLGDTGWIESGDVSYTPLGTVDAVRVRMEVEGEGDTGPMGNDHAALAEIWVDHVSVVAETSASTEDNLLTWDASPDDPAGVSHYNIYRSANDGGPWDTPMETVDADGSSAYSFVDTGAGTGDDVLWWYVVRVVSGHGMEEDNTHAVREPSLDLETFDIQLYAYPDSNGWNFVSFNLIPTDTSLESILEDTEYGIAGNYDRVMHYDSSAKRWHSHLPGRAERFNNLDRWDHRMGIWILMTGDDVLTIVGTEPTSTSIVLEPGWNLVGLPSGTSGNHGLPSEIGRIGYFQASEDYNVVYTTDVSSFVFEPGKGYWIHNPTESAVVWTVNY